MDSLVSTEWLEDELGAPDLRIVDATFFLPDRQVAIRGPNMSRRISPARSSSTSPRSPISTIRCRTCCRDETKFASRMQTLGIGDGNRIVVYDNSPLHTAARAWWMLKAFGAHHVAILDGGLQKWMAEGRPFEIGRDLHRHGHFTARLDANDVADKAQVLAVLDAGDHEIVDARAGAALRRRGGGAAPRPRLGPYARLAQPAAVGAVQPRSQLQARARRCRRSSTRPASILRSRWSPPAARASPPRRCCSPPICSARRTCASMTAAGPNGAPIPTRPRRPGAGMSRTTRGEARDAARRGRPPRANGRARRRIVNPPVWRASTMLFDSVAAMEAANPPRDGTLHYGRNGAPDPLGAGRGADRARAGRGGDEALSDRRGRLAAALLTVLSTRATSCSMVDSVYGPTRAFCETMLKRFGRRDALLRSDGRRRHRRADRRDAPARSSSKAPAPTPSRCRTCRRSARRRRRAASSTLIDNTWATPLFFPAIAAGCDLSILACTKYIGGHADLMLGSVTATESWCRRGSTGPAGCSAMPLARRCLAGAARPAHARRAAAAARGERRSRSRTG